MLSREWRCSWSSADRRYSNNICVVSKIIAYYGVTYIGDLTVLEDQAPYELLWLYLKIEYQDNSPSNDHQGNMPPATCPIDKAP